MTDGRRVRHLPSLAFQSLSHNFDYVTFLDTSICRPTSLTIGLPSSRLMNVAIHTQARSAPPVHSRNLTRRLVQDLGSDHYKSDFCVDFSDREIQSLFTVSRP